MENMESATFSLNRMTPSSCKAINLFLRKSATNSVCVSLVGEKCLRMEQFLVQPPAAKSLPSTSHLLSFALTMAMEIRVKAVHSTSNISSVSCMFFENTQPTACL